MNTKKIAESAASCSNVMKKIASVPSRDILNVTLSAFVLSLMIATWVYIDNQNPTQYNQITVTGTADYYMKPDIAKFNVTFFSDAKTAAEAQKSVVESSKKLAEITKTFNIKENDIKTISYTSNPKYEYRNDLNCRPNTPCNGRNIIVGYNVSQTTSIKLRELDKAGDMAAQVTALNPQTQTGPEFSIEDPEKGKKIARELAIEKAKEKAKSIAKSLDMDLGKIVNFNEDNSGGVMYANQAVGSAAPMNFDIGRMEKSVAPVVSAGEDKISTTVNITYKLR